MTREFYAPPAFLVEDIVKNAYNNKKTQTVFTCSAIKHINIDKIWHHIDMMYKKKHNNGEIEKKRKNQNVFWLKKYIVSEYIDLIKNWIRPLQKSLTLESENKFSNLLGRKQFFNDYLYESLGNIENLKSHQSKLQKEIDEINKMRNIISSEDLKKKVSLHNQNARKYDDLKKKLSTELNKKRTEEMNKLVNLINPLLENYMKKYGYINHSII